MRPVMEFRKVIRRKIRRKLAGGDVASDINVVIAGNVGSDGKRTRVSSEQRIVQRADSRSRKERGGEKHG